MKKGKKSENRSNSEAKNQAILTLDGVLQHPGRRRVSLATKAHMNWLRRLFATCKKHSGVERRTQSSTDTAEFKGWHSIGRFNLDGGWYDDAIPRWVVDRIPASFNRLAANKRRYLERRFGRRADAVALELSWKCEMYNGEWHLNGTHFQYKVVFEEHDDFVGGEVLRRAKRRKR